VNWVDLVIVGATAATVIAGLARGALRTVFPVAGVVIGFLVASRESGAVGVLLSRWMRDDLAQVTGFVVTFFGIALVFVLIGHLLRALVSGLLLGWLDRLAGGVLGFLQAAVALGVLALVVEGQGGFPAAHEAATYPYALQAGQMLLRVVPENTQARLHWDRLRSRLRDVQAERRVI
jgi:membrane protein required for colicin V production